MAKILQINLNHACQAQSLCLHSMAERGCSVGIIAEPYRIPDNHPLWMKSECGTAAITWRKVGVSSPCTFIEAGRNYVAGKWGKMVIYSIYLSPALDLVNYERRLDRISESIRRQILLGNPVLIAGDFNAKSQVWGSRRPNKKGEALIDWAAVLNLEIINTGNKSTCVRPQGESIVDLTWADPRAARMIRSWKVLDIETLSDHKYIEITANPTKHETLTRRKAAAAKIRRWAVYKMDEDAFIASILATEWGESKNRNINEEKDIEDYIQEIMGIMTNACDASMPRTRYSANRKAYWWTEEISDLRKAAIKTGRTVDRTRRIKDRNRREERLERAREQHKTARMTLKNAIRTAKGKAWEELVGDLNKDPWGRPYKIVLKKLRGGAPPLTETLDPCFMKRIVDALFPRGDILQEPIPDIEYEWKEEDEISLTEIRRAVKRIGTRKAPGPDGIPGKAWKVGQGELGEHMKIMFNECLKTGTFPKRWKKAKLVLLQKPGKAAEQPSAYRPICLLDEAGKILERLIAERLTYHLSQRGPDLSENQFGFRGGKSTIDAILSVRSTSETAAEEGGVLLAVSLDISNAFNTLPWDWIGKALIHHKVPTYLIAIIKDYFCDRKLEYVNRDGLTCKIDMVCGVPQGSVLGPLLWNLAYDQVLRSTLPIGCSAICYADDTLVLANGEDWQDAIANGNMAVAVIVRSIRTMGLKVAAEKTEAMFLHDGTLGTPPPSFIRISDTRVQTKRNIKYLGLQIDETWSFKEHFSRLIPRVEGVAMALARLLPNLGGPDGRVRRVYAGVINSIILYGAPVWSEDVSFNMRLKTQLNRTQRRIAQRAVRGYKTISHAAATVLSGLPPIDLVGKMHAMVYRRIKELREENEPITDKLKSTLREQAQQLLIQEWRKRLEDPNIPGKRTVQAILPLLPEWIGRSRGGLSFRLTQILSGHGCHGEYLHRIGKEETPKCHHCNHHLDSAQHTLESCPAWAPERSELQTAIGMDLSLPKVIEKMIKEERAWEAVTAYCNSVMLKKEDDERKRRGERQRDISSDRTRGGGNMPPPTRRSRKRRQGQGMQGPPKRNITTADTNNKNG